MRYAKPWLLILMLLIPPRIMTAPPLSFQKESLAGTGWKLASSGKPGAESKTIEGSTVTLRFSEGGKVGGSGGCNSYGGEYRMSNDNGLSLSGIISTKRACLASTVMQQEQRYFEALGSVCKFKLAGNQLTIFYDEGRSVLNFVTDLSAEASDQRPDENPSVPAKGWLPLATW